MSVLSNAARNAGVDAIVTLLNNGSTNLTPRLVIGTNNMASELAILNFSSDAFGNAVSGVATANVVTSATALLSGLAAEAQMIDRDENIIISDLSVGTTSASDIYFADVNFIAGSTISINQLTVTLPA